MQLLSNKYDTVITDMTNQQKQMADIRRRVERMDTGQGNAEINNLKKDMNELEWHNHKLNLELHGIQKTEHENLLEKVNAVAASLKVPELTESDVTAVHRLPSKPDKTPGIIVRFTRQTVRDKWLQNKKKLVEAKSDVFIQENLTKQTRTLLWETKKWAEEKGFRFVWHSYGKVLVRRCEGERAVVVRSRNDLSAIA
ncbi:hypothetical protein HPB48_009916 [Haemaphysalis longicornis]|uniref:FP protein C-terminal domain-containing protein n=1 Tax=Haemaphysalis longicornis TaxID=44386 RepID=A0A9J6H089_HAELO|nr:hypothetical protein HPB48_009916 [Haemaphysalis longicornis]